MSGVRLAFDASTSPGVLGYHVYWGTGVLNYNGVGSPITILAPATTGQINIDETRVWHIAATAFDANLESDFSTELVATLVLGCEATRAN